MTPEEALGLAITARHRQTEAHASTEWDLLWMRGGPSMAPPVKFVAGVQPSNLEPERWDRDAAHGLYTPPGPEVGALLRVTSPRANLEVLDSATDHLGYSIMTWRNLRDLFELARIVRRRTEQADAAAAAALIPNDLPPRRRWWRK